MENNDNVFEKNVFGPQSKLPPVSRVRLLIFILTVLALILFIVFPPSSPQEHESSGGFVSTEREDPPLMTNGLGYMRVAPAAWLERCSMPSSRLREIDKLLRAVTEILESMNITYFLDSATAMGALRVHAPLPFDDDVDICVFEEDFLKHKREIERRLTERSLTTSQWDSDFGLNLPKVSFYSGFASHNQQAVLDFFLIRRHPKRPDHFEYVAKHFRVRMHCPWSQRALFAESPIRNYSTTQYSGAVSDEDAAAAVKFVEKTKLGYLARMKFAGKLYPVAATLGFLKCVYGRWDIRLRWLFTSPHGVSGQWCVENFAETYDIRRRRRASFAMLKYLKEVYGKSYEPRSTVLWKLLCSHREPNDPAVQPDCLDTFG